MVGGCDGKSCPYFLHLKPLLGFGLHAKYHGPWACAVASGYFLSEYEVRAFPGHVELAHLLLPRSSQLRHYSIPQYFCVVVATPVFFLFSYEKGLFF